MFHYISEIDIILLYNKYTAVALMLLSTVFSNDINIKTLNIKTLLLIKKNGHESEREI